MNPSVERLVPVVWALFVVLAGALSPAEAGDFSADVAALSAIESGPLFDEDRDGYDKHADIFYYSDKLVAREYERSNYMATQVTLAGQAADLTGRPVKPAVHPFAVAQRSFKQFGTLKDRWDVKDTAKDVQYMALYHGKGSDYVVNKVRAHLLRKLANEVNDLIPALDRTAEPDAAAHQEEVETIQDNFRATVERVFREVDSTIRHSMPDNDDSKASATVVIISKNFIITIGVGKGTVVSYDDDFNEELLIDQTGQDGLFENHLFGVKKTRQESIQPRVQFYSRLETNYQFLLIETPSLSAAVPHEVAVRHVLNAVEAYGADAGKEQELYSSSLRNILDHVSSSLSSFQRFFMHSDYSVMLVGLETDYSNIH